MDKARMMKMLASKKGKDMPDVEKKAKLDVLQSLRGQAEDAMKDKLGSMKKVSVMSDSNEGMEKGLDKAKDMMHKHLSEGGMSDPSPEMADESDEESPDHEASESADEERMEDSAESEDGKIYDNRPVEPSKDPLHMSVDELEAQLQHLMAIREHKIKNS